MLEQETHPSWLASVKEGATTVPESRDGFQKKKNSQNHYSYGAVCDFLISGICGIQPDPQELGFKHFILKPIPGGTLDHAEARFNTVYGEIRSSWAKEGEDIHYSFHIPANTTASVILVEGETIELGSGDWKL